MLNNCVFLSIPAFRQCSTIVIVTNQSMDMYLCIAIISWYTNYRHQLEACVCIKVNVECQFAYLKTNLPFFCNTKLSKIFGKLCFVNCCLHTYFHLLGESTRHSDSDSLSLSLSLSLSHFIMEGLFCTHTYICSVIAVFIIIIIANYCSPAE